MKKINIKLLALSLVILGACSQDVLDLEAPETTTPETTTPSKGNADFTKFVSIGNSLTAGFQAGALFNEGQQNSLPLILSKQFSLAQGTTLAFNQPDINSVNGYYTVAGGKVLGRLVLFDADGTGPKTPAPAPAGTTGMPAPYTGGDAPGDFDPAKRAALNNFAVPGILLGQLLTPATGGPATGNPAFNRLYNRFASNPSTNGTSGSTILGDAIAAQPSFVLVDIGNNDILGYATNGGDNAGIQMTSEAAFGAQYAGTTATVGFNGVITSLLLSNANLKGVIANIPDVTTIPYFTTVAWNAIVFKDTDGATITATNNAYAQYNAGLSNPAFAGILTSEEIAKRKISFKVGSNGIVIEDESLTNLTAYGLPSIRQATSSDLITLSAGGILGTLADPANPSSVWGVGKALTDKYALIPTEITAIKNRTIAFNTIIKNTADGSNGRLALADVNATFTALVTNRAGVYNGVTITPNFAPPTGAFSEDGVHPNSRGYAFMANIFIDAINAKFSANVPKASLADYKGTGLPVSAQ